MKTVFKVGQKVYDEVNFPGKEGVIIDTNKNNKLNLLVKFDSVNYLYTLKGIYLGCNGTPTLSTKPYEIEFQGFEQKAPTPTYEEAEEWMKKEYAKGSLCLMMRDVFEALEAFRKLIVLRDYYNEGWQPDWNNRQRDKFGIMVDKNMLCKESFQSNNKPLVFKSREIRDRFFEDQRELLEIAKPLL